MLDKTSFRPLLLLLVLALPLAGWAGCKATPDQENDETADAGQAGTETPAPAKSPGSQTPAGEPAAPADDTPIAVQDLPEVVAKVNGQEIKKGELLQGAQAMQMQLAQMGQPAAPTVAFFRDALKQVIAVVLLQQEAKAQGVTATEQEVQQQIDARKRAFPTEDAYQAALAQAGLTESRLRQQMGDQIAVQKYLKGQFGQSPSVTEQATREFYEQNKAQLQQPEQLHLRHILVRFQPNASPADKQQARQKADSLLARVQAGEDFAKLAQEHSDDPGSKANGGDLGWMGRGQTVPAFEKAAYALTQPNELSPVVESPFGYHIIQFLERKAPAAVPYEQVKDRIALLLKQQQTQKQVEDRVRVLREKAKVEIFI